MRPRLRLPSWRPGLEFPQRLGLLLVAIALVAVGALAARPHDVSGAWLTETSFSGELAEGRASTHLLEVRAPASIDDAGLAFRAERASLLVLPPTRPVWNATPFAILVADAKDRALLSLEVDPRDPGSWNPAHHGHAPPVAYLVPGSYRVVVAPLGPDAEGAYEFAVRLTFPFSATRSDVPVPPLFVWGLAAVASLAAVAPRPSTVRAWLTRTRADPPGSSDAASGSPSADQ